MLWPLVALVCGAPASVYAAAWEDATDAILGVTGEWSNKVEIADIDGNGRPDILFANGAGYNKPEAPEQNRAFLNQGPGAPFLDVSAAVFTGGPDYTRAIKARDLDGDGLVDLIVANSFQTQSRLYLGDGQGGFVDATDAVPQGPASFGDVEVGDVDDDGDLDLVFSDWGEGPLDVGGRTRLWLGDGLGGFTDVTDLNMPDVLVAWSWELELADIDNDLDLDILVACKACDGSYMFENDGAGGFSDVSARLPRYGNNYEFEPIDLTGDGYIDLITINDGPQGREHIFVNDGAGGFNDATAELWPDADNPSGDDNMVAFLDFDSDGDADLVIAGLFSNEDRLLLNSGDGHLSLVEGAFAPDNSSGTLGIALADLDDDARLDVVMAEGEVPQDADRVFLGVDIAVDTAAPQISLVTVVGDTVHARIHDNKTPVMPHDFLKDKVVLVVDGAEIPMQWYGEALWRAQTSASGQVCATDAAGNQGCQPFEADIIDTDTDGDTTGDTTTGTPTTGAPTTGAPTTGTPTTGTGTTDFSSPLTTGAPTTGSPATTDPATTGATPQDDGCGCRSTERPTPLLALLALSALPRRRRRRRRF